MGCNSGFYPQISENVGQLEEQILKHLQGKGEVDSQLVDAERKIYHANLAVQKFRSSIGRNARDFAVGTCMLTVYTIVQKQVKASVAFVVITAVFLAVFYYLRSSEEKWFMWAQDPTNKGLIRLSHGGALTTPKIEAGSAYTTEEWLAKEGKEVELYYMLLMESNPRLQKEKAERALVCCQNVHMRDFLSRTHGIKDPAKEFDFTGVSDHLPMVKKGVVCGSYRTDKLNSEGRSLCDVLMAQNCSVRDLLGALCLPAYCFKDLKTVTRESLWAHLNKLGVAVKLDSVDRWVSPLKTLRLNSSWKHQTIDKEDVQIAARQGRLYQIFLLNSNGISVAGELKASDKLESINWARQKGGFGSTEVVRQGRPQKVNLYETPIKTGRTGSEAADEQEVQFYHTGYRNPLEHILYDYCMKLATNLQVIQDKRIPLPMEEIIRLGFLKGHITQERIAKKMVSHAGVISFQNSPDKVAIKMLRESSGVAASSPQVVSAQKVDNKLIPLLEDIQKINVLAILEAFGVPFKSITEIVGEEGVFGDPKKMTVDDFHNMLLGVDLFVRKEYISVELVELLNGLIENRREVSTFVGRGSYFGGDFPLNLDGTMKNNWIERLF